MYIYIYYVISQASYRRHSIPNPIPSLNRQLYSVVVVLNNICHFNIMSGVWLNSCENTMAGLRH